MTMKRTDDKNVSIEKFLLFSGEETNETYERFKKIVILLNARKIRPYPTKHGYTAHIYFNSDTLEYVKLAWNAKRNNYQIAVRVKKEEQYEEYFKEKPESSLRNREKDYYSGGREMLTRIIGYECGSLLDSLFFEPLEALLPSVSTLLLDRDILNIRNSDLVETEKQRLISARIGQGDYRKELLEVWGGCCSVTGCSTKELLIASHIQPWRSSNDFQRLHKYNGLLLIATLDKAFDSGLISFNDDGSILISLLFNEYELAGISVDMNIELREENLPYLAHHRENVFRG
ncbi:HNH endonuclease [Vibrio europaeus]|uniref:HNH endonuclease n=1 Tax=Vibrio europaeus TaxID=300876 RepID=UPI00148E1AF6|nr:HNH endonuclease [Vibrio europaeus]NOH25232.1 hypothetical protein [Vibrio europaeus]